MKDKNIVVITSYPTNGSIFGKGISGLASFAKNTVNSIKDTFNITVLAEVHPEENGEYIEEDVKVKRVWKKNSPFLSFTLLKDILKFENRNTKIILEFELATFGGNIATGLISIFLLVSKILGYEVITVLHQVIIDINALSVHLGIEKGSIKASVINKLLVGLTRFIVSHSKKVIVLDEVHKTNLGKIGNTQNVYVIPHGVEVKPLTIVKKPHSKINLFYFGHITWYKGADWLINAYLEFAKINPELADKFFIQLAGGMSPTQRDNPAYIKYYKEIEELASKSSNIQITGYVEEKDFETLFANADIQVLPYRALMSSSGPLSHAFEYEKPVLISNEIAPYLVTQDIQNIMNEVEIVRSDLVFNLDNPTELFTKILDISESQKEKMKLFARKVRERRSWENIGKEYLNVISKE